MKKFLSVILASAVLSIGVPSAFAQHENTSNKQVSPQPASTVNATHSFPFTNLLTTEEYHFNAKRGSFTLHYSQHSSGNTEVNYQLWYIIDDNNHELVREIFRKGDRSSSSTFTIPKAGAYYFEITNRSKDNNNQYIPVSGEIRFTTP
ncbi:putative T9SS type A sorting domain-containing protein [Brevibacillus sp. IT-7CA2]|uniref:hypothetical protein n=1 Tax=Brevibacillus sp. IT-7CA2 TaxID=3026436 RepID=UPI0039DF7C84